MTGKGIALLVFALMLINIGITTGESQIPDLRGTWENVYRLAGSEKADLIEMFGDPDYTCIIENQTGLYFYGYMTYLNPVLGKPMKEGFRGIITEDGKRFYAVQDISGYKFGEITSPDSISFYYVHNDIPLNDTRIDESRVVFAKFVRSES